MGGRAWGRRAGPEQCLLLLPLQRAGAESGSWAAGRVREALTENCENASCAEPLQASPGPQAVTCSSVPVPQPRSSSRAVTCTETCWFPVTLGESHWFVTAAVGWHSVRSSWLDQWFFFVFGNFLRVKGACGQEEQAGGWGSGRDRCPEQEGQGLRRSSQPR